MKIELNIHELQIVMNALDRSHKLASNDIRIYPRVVEIINNAK